MECSQPGAAGRAGWPLALGDSLALWQDKDVIFSSGSEHPSFTGPQPCWGDVRGIFERRRGAARTARSRPANRMVAAPPGHPPGPRAQPLFSAKKSTHHAGRPSDGDILTLMFDAQKLSFGDVRGCGPFVSLSRGKAFGLI